MVKLLIQSIVQFFVLILIFIVIRMIEYGFMSTQIDFDFTLGLFFERSVNLDLIFLVYWSFSISVLCMLIRLLSKKLARYILRFSGFLLILIHLLLTGFFLLSKDVLDASLFEFSISEITKILAYQFSIDMLLILIVIIAISWFSYSFILKKVSRISPSKKVGWAFISIYLICGFFAFSNANHLFKPSKYFQTNFTFLLGNSKETLFVKSLLEERPEKAYNYLNILENTTYYHRKNSDLNFSNEELPLVHKGPYQNVLGPYFIKDKSIKPNIVVLVCESLSSSFSGKACSTPKSLTPFIDSLAANGLYWSNFLSNAERSHGVLTNVLGSLPTGIGERGFANMKIDLPSKKMYPSHITILEPLKSNQYTSSFHYGGWGYYDNAGYFLKEHQLDYLITEDSFDTKKYDRQRGTFAWGYNDKALFEQSLSLSHNTNKKLPFIDIYQTLSLHHPFNLITEEYKSEKFLENRLKKLGINSGEVKGITNDFLSSLFFFEDALKLYFSEVKNREAFKNTIFIITGDHGTDHPISHKILEKYRVPLIIYSDLIKKNSSFKGLCSHVDVTPSLLALLSENFGLQIPNEQHWIGKGLDTSRTMKFNRSIPLAIYNETYGRYVSGNHVLYKDRVIRFDSTFSYQEETDKKKLLQLQKEFENYLFVNEYVCTEDKIWREK